MVVLPMPPAAESLMAAAVTLLVSGVEGVEWTDDASPRGSVSRAAGHGAAAVEVGTVL